MTDSEQCLLYTQDPELARRVKSYLRELPRLKHATEGSALKASLDQSDPALVILDSLSSGFGALLEELRGGWPESLVLVIGPSRSDPVLSAERHGVFAVLDPDFDGRMLKRTVLQGFDRLALIRRLHVLEKNIAARPGSTADGGDALPGWKPAPLPLRHSFPPLRRFEDVDAMLQGTLDEIVGAGTVLRAGAFVYDSDAREYKFAAGIGCSEDTSRLHFGEDSSLVRWLEKHAQLVCRSELRHIDDSDERLMLERALSMMQAELLAPLLGRRRLIGWILLGKLANGAPFASTQLQDVMILSERVATALENSILYREVARQKVLAETMLQSIPTGIAAAGENGLIYWFNEAAQAILNLRAEDVMGKPVEALGGAPAERLRAALDGQSDEGGELTEWFDSRSRRYLRLQAVRLTNGWDRNGAVVFIHDLTRERLLNQRQRELDRSAFWNELAANMSHEIRNPLVAIKTFAQLLPERYQDEEFRRDFSELVSQEVDRLNSLIEQINSFAECPKPTFERLDVQEPLKEAIKLARLRMPSEKVEVKSARDPDLPTVRGDRRSLTECFAHVLANSMEALRNRNHPQITVNARTVRNGNAPRGVEITLSDNAGGIAPEIRDNVFSPFCTGRSAGMGLGLPIAKRTVADHDGRMQLDTDEKGTRVTIVLPAYGASPKEIHETPVDR